MKVVSVTLLAFAVLLQFTHAMSGPFASCKGSQVYYVAVTNNLTDSSLPKGAPAIVFTPPVAVSHSNRVSLLTVRGFATDAVSTMAKTGNSRAFVDEAYSLQASGLVKSVTATIGLTTGFTTTGGSTTHLQVEVDCMNPLITVLAAVAPSPDWIIQISNINMYDTEMKRFVTEMAGPLFAYDAGVDSGFGFTDPDDTSLDVPSSPVLNIAPLVEDPSDPFQGRAIGQYVISRAN